MTTISTTIHYYDFDTTEPDQTELWDALRARLTLLVPHPMKAFEGRLGWDAEHIKPLDGQTIELETEHLFDNQWNTAPTPTAEKGLRVFDWHQIVPYPGQRRTRRQGHWLEQTAAMREIRRNTNKCGFCGRQEPAAKGYVFCPHCLGSEYLKDADLHLTRMRAIDETDIRGSLPPLTDAERAHLLPLYKAEQAGKGSDRSKARWEAKRASIIKDCDTSIAVAQVQRDGLLWCMDHGLPVENVIYYKHTRTFCFGWRTPVSSSELAAILETISEFPFQYEIKCADGRKLEGNYQESAA